MAYGEYNIGHVKSTQNQQKKHRSQMTEEELSFLVKSVRTLKLSSLKVSEHLLNKTDRVSFELGDIAFLLYSANLKDLILEYNETITYFGNKDRRVLFRDIESQDVEMKDATGQTFLSHANLCFVLSIERNEVITVYWNFVRDNHSTINMFRYNPSLNIIH